MNPGLSSPSGRFAGAGVLFVGMAATAVLLLTHSPLRPASLERLELATLDYRFEMRGPQPLPRDSTHVVLVEITDESFTSLPAQYPWPRSYYARLLRNLRAAGARAVGIDLILGGDDVYDRANDSTLRAAISDTRLAVLAGKREQDDPLVQRARMDEDFGNLFYPVDSSLGLVNIRNDPDGVYRRYSPAFAIRRPGGAEQLVPTFGFAVLNRYLGLPPSTVPHASPGGFTYARRTLPGADAGSFLINFRGPSGTFPRVAFHDVLDDASFTTVEEARSGEQINTFSDPDYGYLQSGMFRDRIVLIGMAVPEYKDLFPVAIAQGRQEGDNMMYGVEIHANVIESVLRNSFLARPPAWIEMITLVLLVLLAERAATFVRHVSPRRLVLTELGSLAGAGILLASVFVLSLALFTHWGVVVDLTGGALAVIGGYTAGSVTHLVSERRQRAMIKTMFSTYVSPSLVDELLSHPERLVLGGRRDELTVLFSDIQGFTGIAQQMEPERLVALLNEYLDAMSEVIFRHAGTVDKYEGDAIMAFWGAPLPQADHAVRACRSALEMLDRLAVLNEAWEREGKPHLSIRIGINTGPMVVGNMGSRGKFAYTVIGDSVNVASRLEGANREYHTRIMVTEQTYRLVEKEIEGRMLDRITVRGRSEPVVVYELLAVKALPRDPDLAAFLSAYTAGIELMQQQRWGEAHRRLEEALAVRPGDYPSRIQLARAAMYEKNPPPDWSGIFPKPAV
jgi:adenylate cyclase